MFLILEILLLYFCLRSKPSKDEPSPEADPEKNEDPEQGDSEAPKLEMEELDA